MFRGFFEDFGAESSKPEKIATNRDGAEFFASQRKLTVEIERLVKEELTLNSKIGDLEKGLDPKEYLYDETELEWFRTNPMALLEEYRLRLNEIRSDLIKLREELEN